MNSYVGENTRKIPTNLKVFKKKQEVRRNELTLSSLLYLMIEEYRTSLNYILQMFRSFVITIFRGFEVYTFLKALNSNYEAQFGHLYVVFLELLVPITHLKYFVLSTILKYPYMTAS